MLSEWQTNDLQERKSNLTANIFFKEFFTSVIKEKSESNTIFYMIFMESAIIFFTN